MFNCLEIFKEEAAKRLTEKTGEIIPIEDINVYAWPQNRTSGTGKFLPGTEIVFAFCWAFDRHYAYLVLQNKWHFTKNFTPFMYFYKNEK